MMMGFIKDVKKELDKVHWLSKKEVLGQFLAIHVIGFMIILYFGVLDLIVNGMKYIF